MTKWCSAAKYLDTDSGESNHKNVDNARIHNQVAFGAYKEYELQNHEQFTYKDVTFGFSAIYSNAAFSIKHWIFLKELSGCRVKYT